MKKLIVLFMLSAITLQLSAQSSILFMKVDNQFTLFTRPLPANSLVLNLADNKFYLLTTVASVNSSLSSSTSIAITSEELDPIWLSEKSSYVKSNFLQDEIYNTMNWVADNYALKTWVTSTLVDYTTINYSNTTFASYSWINSQNFLKSYTEEDPFWNSQKGNYSLKAEVHDTAQVLRSEFEDFIQASFNIDEMQYNYTSANADVIFIDSIYIPVNSIVNIESSMISISSTFVTSTWRFKISYKRIANTISPLPNAFSILNREERVREFNFDYNTSNGYIRFRVKGEEDSVKWKLNINYKLLTI